ncbi:MAG: hypothetical protein KDJ65_13420 [Anaerolineae bacterium]|nr:hypothetical protein [Anaerolineae bacterium]
MAPIVHGLENEHRDRINFVYLDVDDPANQDFIQTLGRRAQPEFYLLDAEGNVIKQWFGNVSEQEFELAFADALAE